MLLLQLLDAWRQPLRPLDEYPALAGSLPVVQAHLEAMRAEEAEARADATAFLQGDLAAHRWLAIPLVLAGVVPLLDENERASSLRLSRLSAAVLAQVADCNCGVAAVLRTRLIPRLTLATAHVTSPAYLLAVARLLEVLCQHPAAAEAVRQVRWLPPYAV